MCTWSKNTFDSDNEISDSKNNVSKTISDNSNNSIQNIQNKSVKKCSSEITLNSIEKIESESSKQKSSSLKISNYKDRYTSPLPTKKVLGENKNILNSESKSHIQFNSISKSQSTKYLSRNNMIPQTEAETKTLNLSFNYL